MINNQESRGLAALVSDLAQQVTTLLQTESRLLRAEMSEKLARPAQAPPRFWPARYAFSRP